MDTQWSELGEPHERLRWARIQAGFPTATAAAKSLGLNKDTYSAYEREPGMSKVTSLDHQRAIQFARKFKVSWTWLLANEGTPFSAPVTDAQQRTLRAMAAAPEKEQERAARMVVELLRTGTDD